VLVMLALLGVVVWSLTRPASSVATPTRVAAALATLPPTPTATPTDAPFVFVTPTPVPPTPTATAANTATPLPTDTETSTPVPPARPINTRAPNTPTRTPAPPPESTSTTAPTSTATPVRFQFTNAGAPVVDASRNGCYYVSGYVRDRAGLGLPNVRLRYLIKQPALTFIYDRTRTGAEAGRYELYVGVNGNVVELTVVDENGNPLSPSVPVTLSGSNCWWVLDWRQNG